MILWQPSLADVLILADVFERFRDICMDPATYQLDPAHYVSAPQLSWDAMLKCTEVKLQLISDAEMFRMIDAGMRGGVCMISKRYARANNKHMGDMYDPSQPSNYILYLDANNLYGWAMSQSLPMDMFAWGDPEVYERGEIDWANLSPDAHIGYILEVDLEYPQELHHEHNDYPLAPERMDIQVNMLSEKQLEIQRKYDPRRQSHSIKLVPSLMSKKKYVLHYLTLVYYLQHGMKLVKIHRIIRFRQSRWLQPYIQKNSTLRAQATNEFEKDFFKLMNNAIYGKACENQKNRTDIRLMNNDEKVQKLINKPHCLKYRVFNKQLAAIEMMKVHQKIDKPFYVGFAVLDLSKLHMYRYAESNRPFNDSQSISLLCENHLCH